jgi:hypothetical protein
MGPRNLRLAVGEEDRVCRGSGGEGALRGQVWDADLDVVVAVRVAGDGVHLLAPGLGVGVVEVVDLVLHSVVRPPVLRQVRYDSSILPPGNRSVNVGSRSWISQGSSSSSRSRSRPCAAPAAATRLDNAAVWQRLREVLLAEVLAVYMAVVDAACGEMCYFVARLTVCDHRCHAWTSRTTEPGRATAPDGVSPGRDRRSCRRVPRCPRRGCCRSADAGGR